MGVIREINEYAELLTVEFDEGKLVEYSFKQLEELELAYAITIHKSQEASIRCHYPHVFRPPDAYDPKSPLYRRHQSPFLRLFW